MKRSRKILLCISALALLLGCVLVMSAFLMIGFDFSKLDSSSMTKTERLIEGAFSDIDVTLLEQDLQILPSPDGVCRLSYYENERFWLELTVDEGVLCIKQHDMRDWQDYVNIVDMDEERATLYLPEGSYGTLSVKGSSMDLTLERELSFNRLAVDTGTGNVLSYAELWEGASIDGGSGDVHLENVIGGSVWVECSTGDITLQHCAAEEITLSLTSGDIEMADVVAYKIDVETNTGSIEIERSTPGALTLKTTTGDIELENVSVQGELQVQTTSGDVSFSCLDAASLVIKLSTGDVEGTLLSGKVFEASTASGSVRVPQSDPTGGACKITTTTGDIEIDYAK